MENNSLNRLQEEIEVFCSENNMLTSLEFRILDLISEVGELSKEILKVTNYGNDKINLTEEMKSEFGDVLFSLIASANCAGVNLSEELESALNKYKRRLKKGSAGSEND